MFLQLLFGQEVKEVDEPTSDVGFLFGLDNALRGCYICGMDSKLDYDKDPSFFTGWLLPTGELLGCDYYGHVDAAFERGVVCAEDLGWIHYHSGKPEPTSECTAAQMRRMNDIALASKYPLPEWVEDCRIRG